LLAPSLEDSHECTAKARRVQQHEMLSRAQDRPDLLCGCSCDLVYKFWCKSGPSPPCVVRAAGPALRLARYRQMLGGSGPEDLTLTVQPSLDFLQAAPALIGPCPFSKLDPRGFIGGFARLAIACLHGGADQQSGPGRPKRTPNPHHAGARSDRAAPSNCRTGAQPNSAPLLPSYRSAVLDLAVSLVAARARKLADRSARDRFTLAL